MELHRQRKFRRGALRILADEIESGHRRPSPELARVLATEVEAPDTEDLSPEEWARAWGAEIDRRLDAAKSGRTKRRDLAAVLGRRVRVSRPRARGIDGGEIALPTWERFAGADPLTPRPVEQMVLGVSTRHYARSIEPAPAALRTRGTSRSAVSRRFVAATTEKLAETMARDLSGLAICAVMIDGILLGEHLVLVALGIDGVGDKHVLGLYEGATENETVCAALLSDLKSRGLRADRSMLFVVDGSKALAKAIRSVYGKRAVLQRCQGS